MSFWTNLLPKKEPSFNNVLIDVGANSVAGAYVQYQQGEKPTILSAHRLLISRHADEASERAMLRALHALGDTLITEGAPHVARATGSGAADQVIASIDAPWSAVMLRIKHINPREPLVFNQKLVDSALADAPIGPGRVLADESLVGTVLNGYPTRDPYGKQAHRATIVALTSHIDQPVSEDVVACLRGLFHIDRISLIGSGSLRYQAMRVAFAHEHHAGILDTMGPVPALLIMQGGIPISLADMPDATAIIRELTSLRDHFSLPRTLFLLERDPDTSPLRQLLGSIRPLHLISVRPSHLTNHVYHAPLTPPDLPLLLMALHGSSKMQIA